MERIDLSVLRRLLLNPYFIPICLAFYLCTRIAVVWFIPIDQHSDNLWYYNRAVALATGQGYSEGGIPTAYWPPGWPGLLGLLFWTFGPSVGRTNRQSRVCSGYFLGDLALGVDPIFRPTGRASRCADFDRLSKSDLICTASGN